MIYTTHPKVSWGESSFSRGESRAFATGGGVLLNSGVFEHHCRSWTADHLLRALTSHCIMHGGCITSALNDTPVLAERLVTGLAWKLGAWWKKLV